MFRGKKLIAVVVLATVIIAGSIGGVLYAQTESNPGPGPGYSFPAGSGGLQNDALLNRAAEIYKEKTGTALDTQALKDAFAQAANELRAQAMDAKLKQMVESGKITQPQADQLKKWQESRPDMTQFQEQLKEWQKTMPNMPPEMNEWMQSRPDVPMGKPFMPNFGFRGPRGFSGVPGWGR